MRALLWNCRGAGKPSFAPAFRRLVHLHRPEICVLFETRLSGRSLQKARAAVPRSWGFHAVESQGLSGGIIVTWAQGDYEVDVFNVCKQEVILVISEANRSPWVLAAVYASTDYRERRRLWAEATQLINQGYPMIVADLGFSGPQFTWCNNQQGQARVWERLDRAFATPGWVQCFSDYQVRHLPRIASDHCPLLVSTDAVVSFRSPFRFEKFWTCYPRSWEIVRAAWGVPVRGDAMYRVSRLLELTKRRLKRWNQEEVGNIFRRIEEAEEAIAKLQTQEAGEGGLAEEELGELRSLLAMHDSLLRQQEILWRQKSRVQWIQEGDRNTRFFHQAAVIRRHRNRIRAIRDEDGQLVEDPDMIRRVLEGFFRARWSEQTGPVASEGPVPPSIRVVEEDTAALIRPVLAREIQEVMWSLEGDKTPGPDGFPPFFFRRYWMIVGQRVTEAIQQYFSTAVMSTDWQRTLVTLIPKRQDASEPSHFRPISLCTTLYKVTAKILALRLRDILPRLISPEQGAFVGGRSITDNVLIAQEFMFDLGRASSRRSLMGIKLDMERAYDRMRWDFVQQSLQGFGFPEAWIRWVMGCIRAPSFAIPVNGSPSRNASIFEGRRLPPRMVVDRAMRYAREVTTAAISFTSEIARDIWGTLSAATAPSMSVDGVSGGAGFVIRDHRGRLIAAGGCRTPGFTAVGAELRAAWEGIAYARRVLRAEHICLEGDSSVVIDWIRGVDRFGDSHPLIREVRRLAQELSDFQAAHVFREANSVADWVASFVARHSGEVIWTSVGDIPPTFYSLLSFDLAGSSGFSVNSLVYTFPAQAKVAIDFRRREIEEL
ncbi:uncharacterized protein LOC120111723 [Phoenix dactylifera]|uniref:Uncharacterized protein LOC120111723 n=1 Tax=Phoenix dactylifera TaxID=42345 RepID=A0A8B9AIA6_PHODC|nr:uncharacterized protein LOC120111723 [Phoenix dactylifera]